MTEILKYDRNFWTILQKLQKKKSLGIPLEYVINLDSNVHESDIDSGDENSIIKSFIKKGLLVEVQNSQIIGTTIHYFLSPTKSFHENYHAHKDIYDPETVSIEKFRQFLKFEEKPIKIIDNKNINIIEVLIDETKQRKVIIYINNEYTRPKDFNRGKSLNYFYNLASEREVQYDKPFFDYFNSNKNNPLYSKHGFKITKILKKEGKKIIPNITIKMITQKAVTRRTTT